MLHASISLRPLRRFHSVPDADLLSRFAISIPLTSLHSLSRAALTGAASRYLDAVSRPAGGARTGHSSRWPILFPRSTLVREFVQHDAPRM